MAVRISIGEGQGDWWQSLTSRLGNDQKLRDRSSPEQVTPESTEFGAVAGAGSVTLYTCNNETLLEPARSVMVDG
jgi:hypothetical protein